VFVALELLMLSCYHRASAWPVTNVCATQVVAGAPGSRLVDLVVAPQVLVQQDNSKSALRLNATYYITKQVRA
jgi:hypothetical protein